MLRPLCILEFGLGISFTSKTQIPKSKFGFQNLNSKIQMDPIPIKKDIINILQRFFKQDPVFTYRDDQDKTGILVADVFGIDRKNTEQYPAVIVARGLMRYGQVGIGNRASSNWSASAQHPSDTYGCMVEGSLVCHCISYNGIEAEQIATRVAAFLQMTKSEIGEYLKITIKDVGLDDEKSLRDLPAGIVDVQVVFGYSYGTAWKTTDLDTVIRGCITKINTAS